MLSESIKLPDARFRLQTERLRLLREACSAAPEQCDFLEIGVSEEGRCIAGIRIGCGPRRVSLVAGAHADEPVGPETITALVLGLLSEMEGLQPLLEENTFFVVPHVNPDGEARNQTWMAEWPHLGSYLAHVFRELPGRDVEFCYPDRRIENAVVSDWLERKGPFDLHMSLHGMGFSDGAMLLIERLWGYRTEKLQTGFALASKQVGLRLHDHNRKGEKGFFSIAPGFTTTPEGAAMRAYFRSRGQLDTANLFGDSSMEFIKSLGGDPLCLVTELPLFVIDGPCKPGHPTAYLEFKADLADLRTAAMQGKELSAWMARYGLRPMPLADAVWLQLKALELGIETVAASR